ncbi:hypothetical protein K504DRAFT_143370 [Pleomassaria siparia CBS 279.74]|uniref:Amidohydrolase-related domain-containing protein n=1 Tax=Pleomassaria siparia CBS 279.74 TaxID=1314801 RepID=A0A6G1KLZ6_9PLEO|nr:hypothetical protein K504DRAFT_143370 [Pleomassaria siparia CBS 279.74]
MPSTERAILDTHIHLWPSTAVSPTDHGWMSAGHTLARRHGISDYSNATTWSSPVVQPKAFIYLETDRYLPSPEPDIGESVPEALKTWAKAPLNELKFLRRIVEETPQSGDGFVLGGDGDGDGDGDDDDGPRMAGCVIWAPFHLSTALFNAYLEIAEQVAGPQLWAKVVGFRYLLQGKGSSAVQQLVRSEQWLANLLVLRHGRKGRGWSFDIGVDAHRDGVEVVGYVADMVERLRALENEKPTGRGVRFVLGGFLSLSLSLSITTTLN